MIKYSLQTKYSHKDKGRYAYPARLTFSSGRSVYKFKCNNYCLKQRRISPCFYFPQVLIRIFSCFAATCRTH